MLYAEAFMKYLFIVLSGLLAFTSLAFCQVDTMRLLEVGSVTAPGTITNWYFEDLNGDSIKEIILTTANSVNIYSGSTFSPIWSQSGFTNPKDLNFADINNDGLIDFSVKEDSHIYLIDPHHSTTIWTSPMLDFSYRCYAIGNWDSDNFIDIAIVTQEINSSSPNVPDTDSVYVDIYQGINFQHVYRHYSIVVNLQYYYSPDNGYSYDKFPTKIWMGKVVDNSQLVNRILLYIHATGTTWGPGGFSSESHNGNLQVFTYNQTSIINSLASVGLPVCQNIYGTATSPLPYIVFERYSHSSGPSYYNSDLYCDVKYYIDDSCAVQDTIWNHTSYTGPSFPNDTLKWLGFSIGNFRTDIQGDEIAYGSTRFLNLKEYPSLEPIWITQSETSYWGQSILGSYRSNMGTPNDSSWIVIKKRLDGYPTFNNQYRFVNTQNGLWRKAIYTRTEINGVLNVSANQNSFLYVISGLRIFLYNLAPRVGVDNPEMTPTTFFLAPNYPNPFNASTMIEYSLPESGPVKVDIFDILGRKIQTLVDETQAAGFHQVAWNGDNLPSGTYFYRIQAGEKTQTKKCLLLK
jgi:hypothetical protein